MKEIEKRTEAIARLLKALLDYCLLITRTQKMLKDAEKIMNGMHQSNQNLRAINSDFNRRLINLEEQSK